MADITESLAVLPPHADPYDVLIVGAGPAGLFTALELMKTHRVAIVDAGKPLTRKSCPLMTIDRCTSCKPVCHILGGFGGAQFFQGTKLARYPAGEALLNFIDGVPALEDLYNKIDSTLERFGKSHRPAPDPFELEQLRSKCMEMGLEFRYYNSQKVSRLEMNTVGAGIAEELANGGVEFFEKQLITSIDRTAHGFTVSSAKERWHARRVVLALGRVGSRSMQRLAGTLGLEFESLAPEEIEIGVRVETPYHVFNEINGVHNDIKVKKSLGENGAIKTFCQEYRGYLTKCCFNLYGDSTFSTIDGYILGTEHHEPETRSEVSNLGIHHRFKPTGGLLDAYEMVRNISAKQQPIFQSMRGFLGGFVDGEFSIRPSMPDAELADINQFLPSYSGAVIKEFVGTLAKLLPGFNDPGNIVYAPSFELGAAKLRVTKSFESSVPGVYVAGDACGHFRGAMQAMASGITIARGIARSDWDGLSGSSKTPVHGFEPNTAEVARI